MTKAGRTTSEWRKLRIQCFKRDKRKNAVCHICHQPIDYSVKPSTTSDSYEPDHRYSADKFPELAELPENILPSHMSCNRSRRDRAAVNEIGNQSRAW